MSVELGSAAEHQPASVASTTRTVPEADDASAHALLAADQLHVSFPTGRGQRVTAVENVSFTVAAGETLGIVGESGCGKTTVARCLVGLLRPDSGTVSLRGAPLGARRSRQEHRAVQLVFQDPFSSLNPRLSVRSVLRELLVANGLAQGESLERRCQELMGLVGLPVERSTAIRRLFRGASASGSPLPERWPSSRRSSWPTNPSRPSTSPCRLQSWPCSRN